MRVLQTLDVAAPYKWQSCQNDSPKQLTGLNHLQIVAFWLIALRLLTGSSFSAQVEGSYVAQTLNGRPLPADLRLPAQGGDFRLFRLEQGVLRLASGGKFTLYFRYYHQLVRRGSKPASTPVLSESESGTYKVQDGSLVLTPATKKGGKSRPVVAATIKGPAISASYVLEPGGANQRVSLTLQRDPTFW